MRVTKDFFRRAIINSETREKEQTNKQTNRQASEAEDSGKSWKENCKDVACGLTGIFLVDDLEARPKVAHDNRPGGIC